MIPAMVPVHGILFALYDLVTSGVPPHHGYVPQDEYLTVAEVAARLKIAPKTVRNRMHDGTWRRGEQWFSQPGISPRFRWSALVRWLENGDSVRVSNDGLAYGPDIPRERPARRASR